MQDEIPVGTSRRSMLGLAGAVGALGLVVSADAAAATTSRTGLGTEDVLAIHDLLARYAWYLDTHQSEKWAALFSPDGKAIFTQSKAETPAELLAYTKVQPGSRPELRQHHVGNILIDAEPDGRSCKVRSYMTATFFTPGGNLHAFLASGVYRDICVKLENQWYFKERRYALWDAKPD